MRAIVLHSSDVIMKSQTQDEPTERQTRQPAQPPWYAEFWSLLSMTFVEWRADNASRLAAALAYYTIFSLAPLLVIVVGIAGLVLGQEVAQASLVEQVRVYTSSPRAAELVQTVLENTSVQGPNLLATLLSLALLLYGATGAFNELRNALNLIWDVPAHRNGGVVGFVIGRAVALAMVIVAGILLLLSLVASTLLAFVSRFVDAAWSGVALPSQLLTFVVLFVLTMLVFALIYKFVPDVHLAWSDVWIGAAATGLLFSLGRWAISLYLSQSNMASIFGAAGSVILLLIWVYYSALTFFLGAEFTQVYGRLRGSRVAESALLAEPEMTRAPATVETEEGIIMPQAIIDANGEGTTEDAVAEPSPSAEAQPGRVRRAGRATVAAVASVAAAMTVIVAVSIYSLVREPFRRE